MTDTNTTATRTGGIGFGGLLTIVFTRSSSAE
jgi:hypothetical protein